MNTIEGLGTVGSFSERRIPNNFPMQNETLGRKAQKIYINQETSRIIEPVLKNLVKNKSKKIIEQVSEIISILIEQLIDLDNYKVDMSHIPSLFGTNLDDGSFLMEWLFNNYRIGFAIEKDRKESIWYLMKKSESSDNNTYGNLAKVDKKELLSTLVKYVALNS